MRLQEQLRGFHQSFALGHSDRSRAATERAVTAIAHLHEDQCVRIAHHEVEFAETRVEVALQQAQARALQMR